MTHTETVNLPTITVQSATSFAHTPPCGPCLEDDERKPAVMVVNDEPLCWDCTQAELT